MMIIGVDYHPRFQTIAFFMEETGECGEQELNHSDGQAEKFFYRDLKQRGICVRVGMEATGYSRWFERLLTELGFEIRMGDPAEIRTKRVKKRKEAMRPISHVGDNQLGIGIPNQCVWHDMSRKLNGLDGLTWELLADYGMFRQGDNKLLNFATRGVNNHPNFGCGLAIHHGGNLVRLHPSSLRRVAAMTSEKANQKI